MELSEEQRLANELAVTTQSLQVGAQYDLPADNSGDGEAMVLRVEAG